MAEGKRTFGEDDPANFRERFEISGESGRVAQSLRCAEKDQAAGVERLSQTFEEQATKAARENVDGEKEVGIAGDPTPVRRQTAAGHDAVNMGMMGEGLP